MSDVGDKITREVLKSVPKDALMEELATRGEIVEVASKGPDDWSYYGSAGIGRCLGCRFFTMSSSYKSGRGNCHIRAPGPTGFPEVRAGAWCGEWQERLASQSRYHEPPIETVANHTVVPFVIAALDGIEALARNRLNRATNQYGGKGAFADDAERMIRLCEMARRCGLYDHAEEELRAALDEPFPFEVAATMKKLGARDE